MSNKDNDLQVILLVGLLLLALLPALLDRAGIVQISTPAVPEPVLGPSPAVDVGEDVTKNLRPIRFAKEQSYASINSMREIPVPDAPEELRARSTRIHRVDDGRVLQVVFESEPRCMEGDLDIIGRTLAVSDSTSLLLSVEPMTDGQGSFIPLAKEITLTDVGPGMSHSFIIPETATQQHIGLFICQDSAKEWRCRDKYVVDLAKLSDEFLPGRAYTSRQDKSFFFQYFMLNGDDIYNFDISNVDHYRRLGDYLTSFSGGSVSMAELVDRVRHLNTVLNSMPAKVTAREIRINLPRHEYGECEKEGLKLPPELQAALERRGGTVTPR